MTVGLVIVSHSAQLALGVAELANQMTKGATPIAAAGGADNGVLGTSADIIQKAIQAVDGPDGVLVLLDLGSAVLSTEMALELLNNEQKGHIQLTFSPIVEGSIAAALEASLDHNLEEVKKAAEKTASAEQLQQLKPFASNEDTQEEQKSDIAVEQTPQDMLEARFTLNNPAGLHARPASLFVQTAARFQARVEVQGRGRTADATSIIGILSLGARQGETILVRASGADAQAALDALSELVQANFYETSDASPQSSGTVPPTANSKQQVRDTPVAYEKPQTSDMLQGVSTSTGVALGPALLYTSQALSLNEVERRTISSNQIEAEQARLREALDATIQELQTTVQQLKSQVGSAEAAIFDAQALMVRDPQLIATASRAIEEQQSDAASALATAGEQYAAQLEALDDTLLAARAADVRDVTSRVIQRLRSQTTVRQDFNTLEKPVILVARDLTPSDTAQLRPEMVLGICTTQGGPTAHAAILARALGIPAIAGLSETMLQRIHSGDELGMDAAEGVLYLHPAREIRETLAQRMTEQQQRQTARKAAAQKEQEPLVIDGRRIMLLANIGSAVEAEAARQWGAEGVGLLRTEFLFASAQTMPGVEEQRNSYAQVFRAFRGNSSPVGLIVARTLDAGADKPMPALQGILDPAAEANPALGVRGIRVHLAHQELLEQQLKALLLAAAEEQIELHIMLPMITTVEELQTVRSIFERVHAGLKQSNIPSSVPLGIMVEVPAAVVMAPELAEIADFFSIGANDLLQYTLASDRTNAALSNLYNPMQPSILRLMRQVADAGRRAGKPVAVCGEMASDTRLAPVLVGLGIDELSMNPNAIPAVRDALMGHTLQELTELADHVCSLSTVAEVEQVCADFQRG